MFVKTFLVGLMLALKAARAYIDRNQDGIKEHLSSVDWLAVLNALDAINAVLDILIASPVVALGTRVKRNSEEYRTTISNLRSMSTDEYVRIPARVVRREEAQKWL